MLLITILIDYMYYTHFIFMQYTIVCIRHRLYISSQACYIHSSAFSFAASGVDDHISKPLVVAVAK